MTLYERFRFMLRRFLLCCYLIVSYNRTGRQGFLSVAVGYLECRCIKISNQRHHSTACNTGEAKALGRISDRCMSAKGAWLFTSPVLIDFCFAEINCLRFLVIYSL